MPGKSPSNRKMRARNWPAALACAVLLCGIPSGCKRPESATKELTYSIWGSVAQQATEEKVARAFEAENPDVKIEIIRMGSRYSEKIQSMMVGDVAPDVMMVDIAVYDEWASRGVLSEVTDDVKESTGSDEMMPVVRKAFERKGRYFAAPNNCHGFQLYTNLDALKKAGVTMPESGMTWDDLIAMGPKVINKGNGVEFLSALPSFDLVWPSFGARLFNDINAPTEVVRNDPGLREALIYYRKLYESGYFAPADVTSDQGAYQLFRDGRTAFHFDGRWRTPDFAGKTGFEWDVFPTPAGPAGPVTQHGGSGLAIWSKSPNQEAAHRFIRFYTSAKGVEMTMQNGRSIPILRGQAYGPEFLALRPPESIKRFCGTMEEGASAIALYAPGLGEMRRVISDRFEQLIYDRSMSVETIQRAIEDDLERWLARRKNLLPPTK